MTTSVSTVVYDAEHPVCRGGIEARPLGSGMVYLRHPSFSSQIINRESWAFLQMCDGRSVEELRQQIAERLGFGLTLDQLRSSINQFAEHGLFEGAREVGRNYRLFDSSRLTGWLAPAVAVLASRWFAAVTLVALTASIALLAAEWRRFTDEVAGAAREHPIATVLLYYLTFIPIALLHEIGHAIVARYHGGETPEVVVRSNGHFAVLTNTRVLVGRASKIWYLSMGTVVDVYIWLGLLIAYHFSSHYLLLMFLLPQTIYSLIYSYSIFKNSDYLKAVAAWLEQPVPPRPWRFVLDGWRTPPEGATRKLLYVMTASLALKLAVSSLLIWTFAIKEYRVLILYAVYRVLVYAIGNGPSWWSKVQSPRSKV